MEPLIIEPTFSTPAVKFMPNGVLFIGGRSLPEDSKTFYAPVFEWIKNYKGDRISIDIRFEYLNTSSSKQVHTLLDHIKDNQHIENVIINWYYEEGDEEYFEAGKELESLTHLDFAFYEYAEDGE